jgi:hypothetical protein
VIVEPVRGHPADLAAAPMGYPLPRKGGSVVIAEGHRDLSLRTRWTGRIDLGGLEPYTCTDRRNHDG